MDLSVMHTSLLNNKKVTYPKEGSECLHLYVEPLEGVVGLLCQNDCRPEAVEFYRVEVLD